MKVKMKENELTQEESEKIEKEIFPDDEQSVKCDKKTDVLHIIKDWSQIFYTIHQKLNPFFSIYLNFNVGSPFYP